MSCCKPSDMFSSSLHRALVGLLSRHLVQHFAVILFDWSCGINPGWLCQIKPSTPGYWMRVPDYNQEWISMWGFVTGKNLIWAVSHFSYCSGSIYCLKSISSAPYILYKKVLKYISTMKHSFYIYKSNYFERRFYVICVEKLWQFFNWYLLLTK